MLDRESEIYHSGLLCKDAQQEFGAIVVTREGIEISAATRNGFRFEYANTWDRIRSSWAETDARLKARRQEREKRAAFVQKAPHHVAVLHRANADRN